MSSSTYAYPIWVTLLSQNNPWNPMQHINATCKNRDANSYSILELIKAVDTYEELVLNKIHVIKEKWP